MTCSPKMRRFLDDGVLFAIDAPAELVPAEHFSGTDVARHRFAFYGEVIDLPADIDWDHNPGTPHWAHDLNRFGFLVLHSFGQERQARAMEALILDWIRKNDRIRYKPTAYAWQNLLNIAIRIENWWRFLARRGAEGRSSLTVPDWLAVKRSVFRQLTILLRLIERSGYESNWAPIGLRAALYVLYATPSLPHRERLISIAWRGLDKVVQRQVLPDGVQHELSPHYHWVTLELLASCKAMAEQAGRHEGRVLAGTIAAMAGFLDALMLPDGGIVAFGDSDLDYGPRIKAFLDGLDDGPSPGGQGDATVFPYAGIATIRCRRDGHLLAFDAGPFGMAHQHEDALSFWLTAFDEHLLVDPGRYLYDRKPGSIHSRLRSTAAHSTVMVDGQSQNARAHPVRWRRTQPGLPSVTARGDIVRLYGRFEEGYGENSIPVMHERTIESDMRSARWLVIDRLSGAGVHAVESRFQFAPGQGSLAGTRFGFRRGRVQLALDFPEGWRARVLEGSEEPWGGWFSPGINRLEAAPCLVLTAEVQLPVEISVEIHAVRNR